MTPRFILPIAALSFALGGCCCHRDKTAAAHPAASTNPQARQYELAGRHADPLANYGAGTSADIPDNPALGSYPGPLTPPVNPLMGIGN